MGISKKAQRDISLCVTDIFSIYASRRLVNKPANLHCIELKIQQTNGSMVIVRLYGKGDFHK